MSIINTISASQHVPNNDNAMIPPWLQSVNLMRDTPNLISYHSCCIIKASSKTKTRKEKGMLTALDIHTNETVAVQPVAVIGSDAYDTLLIVDARTGNGIWMGANPSQWFINLGRGDSYSDAERVEDIYGMDEDEWEATADMRLAAYGFRLSEFDGEDRYTLSEA